MKRKLTSSQILEKLNVKKGRLRMVLDTDTYNEIDDQFALVYALAAKERLHVEAVYAAPFFNARSESPIDGMEKSYEEILRVLERVNMSADNFVFKGSTRYLESLDTPCDSPAVQDLIQRANSSDELLYVVAIGAITNVASALLIAPEIIDKIVVVWLGGHSHHWPDQREFNLRQDIPASRYVFDCGVPLVQIPCRGVTSHLAASIPELEFYLGRENKIAAYLIDIFKEHTEEHQRISKVIWDISAIAYLINPEWLPTWTISSPILTDECTFSIDSSRHLCKVAWDIDRDNVFRDLFAKIKSFN